MPAVPPAEVIRQIFEARRRGDVPRVLALLHPDVVATSIADGSVLRGIDAVRAYFAGERDGDRRTEVDAHHIAADGDRVDVRGRIRVLSRGSLVDSPACWRFLVRDGRVLRIDPLMAGALATAA